MKTIRFLFKVALALFVSLLIAACNESAGSFKISGSVYYPFNGEGINDEGKNLKHKKGKFPGFIPNEVIVAFEGEVSPSNVQALEFGDVNLLQVKSMALHNAYVYRITGADVSPKAIATELMVAHPGVRWAQPNYILYAMKEPNDPYYDDQWNYPLVHLPEAWDLEDGRTRIVKVAVLDTGIMPHVDLNSNIIWRDGYDFVSDPKSAGDGNGRDPDPTDLTTDFHGTHVAGIIAAVTNNNMGVAGVNWGAKILPIRVLGIDGGYVSDVADAIIWASDRGAEVINMSLGGNLSCFETPALQEAIDYAVSKGIIVVVAAGNDNIDASGVSPASCSGVITVGAVNKNKQRASYSNYGPAVEVMAPGGENYIFGSDGIYSTVGTSSYDSYIGTSMAAPHVAGIVSLMKARNPTLTPDQIVYILKRTADPIDCVGFDECGAGLVNALKALQAINKLDERGFTLSVSPSYVTLNPHASKVVKVRADHYDEFNINLKVENLPDGVNYTFDPPVLTPSQNSAKLIFHSSGSAYAGNYVVTIFGTSDRGVVRAARLSLKIVASDTNLDTNGVRIYACYYTGPPHFCLPEFSWVGTTTGNSFRVLYQTDELNRGQYLMIAWLDINRNNEVDDGDYLGVYPDLVRPPRKGVDLPLMPYSSYTYETLQVVQGIVQLGKTH